MKKIIFLLIILFFVSALSAKSDWITKDKFMHFGASAFITYWNYGVSKDIINNSHKNSLYISVSFTTFLGATKETNDKLIKKTSWNWKDFIYDVAGISFGLVMINNLR